MRRGFELGGIAAAVVLIGFGVAALVMGISGNSTVHDSIKQEKIVGSPDMTPAAIGDGGAGRPASPTSTVIAVLRRRRPADRERLGTARCFARVHAHPRATRVLGWPDVRRRWAASSPRTTAENPAGTSDEAAALKDEQRQPGQSNGARNTWVTETALSTALNASYMAERIALFGIVVGIALLLAGIGFHRARRSAARCAIPSGPPSVSTSPRSHRSRCPRPDHHNAAPPLGPAPRAGPRSLRGLYTRRR